MICSMCRGTGRIVSPAPNFGGPETWDRTCWLCKGSGKMAERDFILPDFESDVAPKQPLYPDLVTVTFQVDPRRLEEWIKWLEDAIDGDWDKSGDEILETLKGTVS